jgi:hypothetical protein
MFMLIGKCRSDDFPEDDFVIIKPVESSERAIHHAASLTSSFYDLKVVDIVMEFENAAAAKAFDSSQTVG